MNAKVSTFEILKQLMTVPYFDEDDDETAPALVVHGSPRRRASAARGSDRQNQRRRAPTLPGGDRGVERAGSERPVCSRDPRPDRRESERASVPAPKRESSVEECCICFEGIVEGYSIAPTVTRTRWTTSCAGLAGTRWRRTTPLMRGPHVRCAGGPPKLVPQDKFLNPLQKKKDT